MRGNTCSPKEGLNSLYSFYTSSGTLCLNFALNKSALKIQGSLMSQQKKDINFFTVSSHPPMDLF